MSGLPSLCSADFKRVLASRPCARSAHFALHHQPPAAAAVRRRTPRGPAADASGRVAESVGLPANGPALQTLGHSLGTELSTGADTQAALLVDDCADRARVRAPQGPRLGLVVPKRLARRAVTRNLVKRQARIAFGRHGAELAPGDWVVRLRSPIDPRRFPSAASQVLRAVLREELLALFTGLASPSPRVAEGRR